MIRENCKSDRIEEAVLDPTVIEIVNEKKLSSKKLTRQLARFVARKVSKDVK